MDEYMDEVNNYQHYIIILIFKYRQKKDDNT